MTAHSCGNAHRKFGLNTKEDTEFRLLRTKSTESSVQRLFSMPVYLPVGQGISSDSVANLFGVSDLQTSYQVEAIYFLYSSA
jgi:hypothetical protein